MLRKASDRKGTLNIGSKDKREKRRQCPLCGFTFTQEEAEMCHLCIIKQRCNLVMCPRCHYEFPP